MTKEEPYPYEFRADFWLSKPCGCTSHVTEEILLWEPEDATDEYLLAAAKAALAEATNTIQLVASEKGYILTSIAIFRVEMELLAEIEVCPVTATCATAH